jgi:capsular exopolysaccharide synthesis family protein
MVPRIPELANKNLEYEKLAQETESVREQFRKLREAEWDIRTAIDQGAGHIERVEPVRRAAIMPLGGGQSNLAIQFIMGGIAGFVCAFMFAMLREVNDTSIRSVEDVNQYIGLDVIGTIPKMRFGSPRGGRRRRATYVSTAVEDQIDACIVTQHDPKSPISEAYRTLRTNFQFATIQEKPRSIMVTSAVPGEGKTTTAVNLGVTMADRGMRVLIVDTDLRRPNVHRVLRMERGPGLSDVLTHGEDYHNVIRPTRVEGMFVISSGRVPPKPSELIGSSSMTRFMEAVGQEFDVIICDAPSVLVVTDPVLLATQVDTTIMVVSTNNARRDTVVRAKELLSTANGDIAGVVVNGLETTRRNYYYYYYYYDDGSKDRRKWYHL